MSQRFVHQASILKSIKHPNICKPIKMLKTSTSLYVVYENCQGVSLSEYMDRQGEVKEGQQAYIDLKIGYNKTIMFSVVITVQMRHCTPIPQPIVHFVNPQSDIKVTNYMFSTHLPDNDEQLQLEQQIQQILPVTYFTAPQVKKGRALSFSDVYSFGKIVQYLNLSESKKGTLSSKQFDKKVSQFSEIIKKTTRRKPFQRLSIQQVYQQYLIPKSKLKKLKSMSMSLSKIGISGKQSVLSRSNSLSTSSVMGGGKNAAFVQEVVLMIVKRHNMAKFLIQCIKNITLCEQHPRPQQLIMLCTLLLKKSTLIINSIGKFMKYCKGIPQLQLNQKQRNRMMKSGDFIKLQPIIQLQVKQQRKLYQQSLQKIYLDNVKLLQNKRFNQQLKKQQIDEQFLYGLDIDELDIFVRVTQQLFEMCIHIDDGG